MLNHKMMLIKQKLASHPSLEQDDIQDEVASCHQTFKRKSMTEDARMCIGTFSNTQVITKLAHRNHLEAPKINGYRLPTRPSSATEEVGTTPKFHLLRLPSHVDLLKNKQTLFSTKTSKFIIFKCIDMNIQYTKSMAAQA